MGLTKSSVGTKAADNGLDICKNSEYDKVIALSGNPNVGKSTVFNGLTGMNQHTGNWPGKTVANAQGFCKTKKYSYILVDIPGTYSLSAHSAEEEVARNFLCFGEPDAVIVVCDATCLERNLNLALQVAEITDNVIICLNMMDEARRKKIHINTDRLSSLLGVPVVSTVARNKKNLKPLLCCLDDAVERLHRDAPYSVKYSAEIEDAVRVVEGSLQNADCGKLKRRWLSIKLLEHDAQFNTALKKYLGYDLAAEAGEYIAAADEKLSEKGINTDKYKDCVVSSILKSAEEICAESVKANKKSFDAFDRKADKILTSRLFGYPVMLALLAFIFWLTITAANYPSQLISGVLFNIQDRLTKLFTYLNAPAWLHGICVLGIYRVLAWVVSVMLPPMAIFFPLFTLLEDSGYLPRIAYNLDKPFKCCGACGKQALTMCMGFGCNAAGIVGCRIIDSPRERLLAVLTNSFVPCNGRFPLFIMLSSMLFAGFPFADSSLLSTGVLTAFIIAGIGLTLLITKLLSKTLLRGEPSSFTLELPPYRIPQIGKVIIRSVFDRTLFVLGRAAAIAAPAGAIIWIAANISIGGESLLSVCAGFLDPFAGLMGLDGVILIAFILGFPANEIVIPIILMAYMTQGTIPQLENAAQIRSILMENGWTSLTVLNVMIFSLLHWPCSTTLLTIKKETASVKWTLLAALIPTLAGIFLCMLTTLIARL